MKLFIQTAFAILSTFIVVSDSFQSVSHVRRFSNDNRQQPTLQGYQESSSSLLAASNGNDDSNTATTKQDQLKQSLVQKVSEFRALKDRDGDVAIDFGVKGGELNETDRAPSTVDFYSISKDVGDKAQEIYNLCDELSDCSPIDDDPTRYIGDRENGKLAPLNGPWKSLFTNAADANFGKNSTRGDAKAQNIVDASKGRITNVIDFETRPDGTEPPLKQLNVVIKAIPVNNKRIELQFKYAKAVFTKLLWFKCRWALYIPVPGPFITRCIQIFTKFVSLGKKTKTIPKGYFDILYLDDNLRIHRTGQDNLFVQVREEWDLVKGML